MPKFERTSTGMKYTSTSYETLAEAAQARHLAREADKAAARAAADIRSQKGWSTPTTQLQARIEAAQEQAAIEVACMAYQS